VALPNTNFDQITAITNDVFLPTLPDLVFDQNVFWKMASKGGTKVQGGAAIRQPVLYQFSKDGAYFDYEKASTAAEDQVTSAEFPWKLYRQRIVISDPELHRNDGPEAIHRLLKAKMMGAANAIRDALGTDLFVTSYGDSVRNINSLPNVLGDSTFPASPLPTIAGGIDKATYTFWRGTNYDYAGNTLGEYDEMATAWWQIVDGDIKPNLILSHTTPVRVHQIEAAGSGHTADRYVNTNDLKSGFTTYSFQGVPWVTDLHCSTTELYMLNMNFLDLVSHANRNFTMRKFQQPDDQDVNIGFIYWMGNLTVSDPSRSGIMYT